VLLLFAVRHRPLWAPRHGGAIDEDYAHRLFEMHEVWRLRGTLSLRRSNTRGGGHGLRSLQMRGLRALRLNLSKSRDFIHRPVAQGCLGRIDMATAGGQRCVSLKRYWPLQVPVHFFSV